MPVRNDTSTRFMDEVRIISPWAFVFAALGCVLVAVAVVFALATDKSGDRFFTPLVLTPFGILAAALVACYILLIGYVSRDAGRRGMSSLLWTLIAIFIPHALGIVLYFVLRKPRTANCPQCNTVVEPGYGFCPQCQCRLNPVCPACQRGVDPLCKFCPHCGRDLAINANPIPASSSQPSPI
jgi:hypothetical protein